MTTFRDIAPSGGILKRQIVNNACGTRLVSSGGFGKRVWSELTDRA